MVLFKNAIRQYIFVTTNHFCSNWYFVPCLSRWRAHTHWSFNWATVEFRKSVYQWKFCYCWRSYSLEFSPYVNSSMHSFFSPFPSQYSHWWVEIVAVVEAIVVAPQIGLYAVFTSLFVIKTQSVYVRTFGVQVCVKCRPMQCVCALDRGDKSNAKKV